MTLFVRMLKAYKSPLLRVRLVSVMGLLVRHATYITEELGPAGMLVALAEALGDSSEKVRI